MTIQFKNAVEKLTNHVVEIRQKTLEHVSLEESENLTHFESLITGHIIPLIKESAIILGRSGCSLKCYSNELAIVRDPKKRIFIQILFYPYGQSKITLGVNAPFLQFAYSPANDSIKITRKISIRFDKASMMFDEIRIREFTKEKIDRCILDFFTDTIKYNTN